MMPQDPIVLYMCYRNFGVGCWHYYFIHSIESKFEYNFRADHMRKNETEGNRFLQKLRLVQGLTNSDAGEGSDDTSSCAG